MTINQQTLRDLFARVAAGDGNARRDFDRHVLPLLDIVVGRWLSQRSHDAGGSSRPVDLAGERSSDDTAALDRLRRFSHAIGARLIAESGKDDVRRYDRQVHATSPSARSPREALPAPETIIGH